jgi:hypothetical protein
MQSISSEGAKKQNRSRRSSKISKISKLKYPSSKPAKKSDGLSSRSMAESGTKVNDLNLAELEWDDDPSIVIKPAKKILLSSLHDYAQDRFRHKSSKPSALRIY